MNYRRVEKAVFLHRENRFIATVLLNGANETVHVKNTGRCRELLVPGATVYLAGSENPARRTAYDLVAVEKCRPGKPPLLINMDAGAPNEVAAEWLPKSRLFPPDTRFSREVTRGNSRFDFMAEGPWGNAFIEVKGVTLEESGVARFPDAPTERGVKHLRELAALAAAGVDAYIFFVIQMKEIRLFKPNDGTHKAFGEALRAAVAAGVRPILMDCVVTPDGLWAGDPVPMDLS